jgi:hypothetical protein
MKRDKIIFMITITMVLKISTVMEKEVNFEKKAFERIL